ncbi:His/Gly/Thr/Pro-type tRNA ligase C-terminal domain-containing protein, partial [Paenibacillus riograndensis]
AAVAEQNNDGQGLIWPAALAPYRVHILLMSIQDEVQTAAAEALYEQLAQLGIEVLLDDRDERAGVKFKDSILMGIPVTIVVGKAAAEGKVEFMDRGSNSKEVIGIAEAVSRITSGGTAEGVKFPGMR